MVWAGQQTPVLALLSPPSNMGRGETRDRAKGLALSPPNQEGGGTGDAAAPPNSTATAAGEGEVPHSRGARASDIPRSLVPKGRSKDTHELHNKGEAVFISFDIETAGEQVGIVQISAEVFRLDLVRNKNKQGKHKGEINSAADTATNIRRDPEVFNK